MNDDYQPHNLKDLLEVVRTEWNNLETLINEFSDSQKTTLGVEGNWSIKDIMVHISAWEKFALDRIQATLTGQPIKYPIIKGEQFVDQFNHQVYDANKDLSLEEVHSDFQKSHQVLMDHIASMNNDVLSRKLPFDWAGNLTIQLVISSNTHWHYVEHAESIEKWLGNNYS